MTCLELLAPAKDLTVGIAAIDCGADAVYIAGPAFGNRKAAGNSLVDIRELCSYAHRFGVRIFLTVNTLIYDGEWEEAHALMLGAQEAGVDAFIIREERLLEFGDITVPMHASTQCAIRDAARARHFESLGCSRIILERGLSLDTVREICKAVSCEVEFFVHGALCVCYSGDCRLSEYLDGRSADRGECIQACRSRYDLTDGSGRVLVKDKALLSLKDFKLLDRLEELAEAGVCSFKIEGRLKNATYVKNVTREYSLALDRLVDKHPDRYCRASFGRVCGGFTPDSCKTFNRGYTQWWLDGRRGSWSSMDTPKSMGEYIGEVVSAERMGAGSLRLRIKPSAAGTELRNGDGFAVSLKGGIYGFRGDKCEGDFIYCKEIPGIKPGVGIWRNSDSAFEKEVEANPCRRELPVRLSATVQGAFTLLLRAVCEDGRTAVREFSAGSEAASNRERSLDLIRAQLSKRSGIYSFELDDIQVESTEGAVPHLGAAAVNAMRRSIAEELDSQPAGRRPLQERGAKCSATGSASPERHERELMRTKYCIKYELGMCPVHQGTKPCGPLYLVNNGRRLALGFDCRRCEMTVLPL